MNTPVPPFRFATSSPYFFPEVPYLIRHDLNSILPITILSIPSPFPSLLPARKVGVGLDMSTGPLESVQEYHIWRTLSVREDPVIEVYLHYGTHTHPIACSQSYAIRLHHSYAVVSIDPIRSSASSKRHSSIHQAPFVASSTGAGLLLSAPLPWPVLPIPELPPPEAFMPSRATNN